MKQFSRLFICAMLCFLIVLSSCTSPNKTTDQPNSSPSDPSKNESATTSKATPDTQSSKESATEPEEEYVFPEDGVLALLGDGNAPSVAVDGRNPALIGNKLLIFFSFAKMNAGLDLAEDTVIKYSFRPDNGEPMTGEAILDSSVQEIKNEHGYIGLCFDMGFEIEFYKGVNFDLSFSDKSGKEYSVKNKRVFKGISYGGLTGTMFDEVFGERITTAIGKQSVRQTGTFNGTDFSFNITLGSWAGRTTPEQIVTLSRLFWECYPRMHARFGKAGKSPTDVTLDIENGGYEIASASGNQIHLHDGWLESNKNDYDCITHELAHVIQNGWDGDKCEYSGFIERFADACRYIYAFDDGKYNDTCWELQTVRNENTRETSVRFLVWMDYTYSNEDNDLLLKFFTICRSGRYPSAGWKTAWLEIVKGSELEGKDIELIWQEYADSEFAKLSTKGKNGTSQLLKKYPVREYYK